MPQENLMRVGDGFSTSGFICVPGCKVSFTSGLSDPPSSLVLCAFLASFLMISFWPVGFIVLGLLGSRYLGNSTKQCGWNWQNGWSSTTGSLYLSASSLGTGRNCWAP